MDRHFSPVLLASLSLAAAMGRRRRPVLRSRYMGTWIPELST
jgi:hypothetical protein